ncbi:hypothetical protein LXL04_023568 [Taraxacum kok-saghyz]
MSPQIHKTRGDDGEWILRLCWDKNQYTTYYMYDPHQKPPKVLGYQMDWNVGFAYARKGLAKGSLVFNKSALSLTYEILQIAGQLRVGEGNQHEILSYFTPGTYANKDSAVAARLAAGLCADLALAIYTGRAKNGFALVRPPGHHAGVKQDMGFCLHNNAAIAAFAAQAVGAIGGIFGFGKGCTGSRKKQFFGGCFVMKGLCTEGWQKAASVPFLWLLLWITDVIWYMWSLRPILKRVLYGVGKLAAFWLFSNFFNWLHKCVKMLTSEPNDQHQILAFNWFVAVIFSIGIYILSVWKAMFLLFDFHLQKHKSTILKHKMVDLQVLRKRGYDGRAADIWSCRVILYVLLTGYLPFEESDLPALYKKVNAAEFSYPLWFPSGAKSLLDKILL